MFIIKTSNTQKRLKIVMNERELKQIDILNLTKSLCEIYDVKFNKSDISQYVSGKTEPNQSKLYILSKALDVTEAWLMGFDVPKERESAKFDILSIPNIFIPQFKKVPLLGTIACGEPILAVGNIEDYIDCELNIQADFALKCKGDSMINARVYDGDIVFIKEQSMVEDGDIAAVCIDEMSTEPTLKKVYITEDSIMLVAENTKYAPLVFSKEEMNNVRIIGKAVAFLSYI